MDASCSVSGGVTVQVCFPEARAAVLDNLNRQREEGRLCDLSIHVQGHVFRAHRCVLAASSPYFHDQVLLKNVTTVSLPSVMDPVAFQSVLSSAYTGQLSILADDIVNYVTVASFLQMWHIVDKCTEILKRPRPSSMDAPPSGATSRQQSPSSSDCLYVEREVRKNPRKPDALPPLATWRRPQQSSRCWRTRPTSSQHLADSQPEASPGYAEGYYAGCDEAFASSSHAKTRDFAPDGPGQIGRHHTGFSTSGESSKQKVRIFQRGAQQSYDRNKDVGDGDGTQDRRKNEKRAIEADEGLGEVAVRKEGFAQMGQCDFHPISNDNMGPGQSTGKAIVDEMKEKVQRTLVANDPSSEPPAACPTSEGVPGPPCPVSGRLQWQTSSSCFQPEPRILGGHERKDQEEEDVNFECFATGTFSRDTFDEIADGTGQVSQRPLVPASPDFTVAGSDANWPPSNLAQNDPLPSNSNRHVSPSSAACPPPSSPPTPSSSSSISLSGVPYTGKVHFCHCGKAYTLKSMRDRHVKMQHLNLRPFGCPVCTKSFKMKHHLTKHLKTHGGLRPYECEHCGKKVIWRDSFLRHQARCERLASSSDNNTSTNTNADNMDNSYAYGFGEGEAFLAGGGQVKVEEVDFHSEMEDGMRDLLGNVSGIVNCGQSLGGHVFKEEATESFSGN